jgi:hypothetical protein
MIQAWHQSALIKAAIVSAREYGITILFTNDRESATVWTNFGFKQNTKRHGTFCRWERELK